MDRQLAAAVTHRDRVSRPRGPPAAPGMEIASSDLTPERRWCAMAWLAQSNKVLTFGQPGGASGGGWGADVSVGGWGGSHSSDQPVEHIRWRRGQAPHGRYRVSVREYKNHGGGDPTPFTVTIKAGGRLHGPVRGTA